LACAAAKLAPASATITEAASSMDRFIITLFKLP
jgi:hypothetical protein